MASILPKRRLKTTERARAFSRFRGGESEGARGGRERESERELKKKNTLSKSSSKQTTTTRMPATDRCIFSPCCAPSPYSLESNASPTPPERSSRRPRGEKGRGEELPYSLLANASGGCLTRARGIALQAQSLSQTSAASSSTSSLPISTQPPSADAPGASRWAWVRNPSPRHGLRPRARRFLA